MAVQQLRSVRKGNGDKILTLSCGFPTTVNPIIMSGLVPVFVDIDLETLNLSPETFRNAIKEHPDIKGVFVAHTLGLHSDIDEILDIAREHDILVFFDCCDAYGTTYKGKPIQSYGKAATYSFYVAHHASMGEGGGITTNDTDLHLTMRSMRNWGRYCASPNCCIRSRHPGQFCPMVKLTKNKDCELPDDYIVNYQYEYLGYNLKPLELQSAMLIPQLKRLDEFDEIRRRNYNKLYDHFSQYKDLTLWKIDDDVSPFGFPVVLKAKYKRKLLVDFMTKNKIETRMLFGGNLMKHPAYANKKDKWISSGYHFNADLIMNNFVMFGVSHVVTDDDIQTICDKLDEFMEQLS
jgi:CDP-6-deoxy-D-xylo-4-hexulose-3-dehydrase